MNGLKDAHFLDGVAGWTASAGTLDTDETTIGGPGRGVLVLSGTASGADDEFTALSAAVDIEAALDPVEIALLAHSLDGANLISAEVRWYAAGGAQIAVAPLTRRRTADRAPSLGAPGSFNDFGLRTIAPSLAATARLAVTLTSAAAGDVDLVISRPYLNPYAPKLRHLRTFDPGASDNPDLNLGVWPGELPGFVREGSGYAAFPSRKPFASDAGIPTTVDVNDGLAGEFTGVMRLTEEEVGILMTFSRARSRKFWFLRPDNGELCIARWSAEGDPALKGARPTRFDYGVVLILQLA